MSIDADPALLRLLGERHLGTLVTLKRDGRPQLSNVAHDFDAAAGIIEVSVTDDRAKTKNLRRDPRASYYVSSDDGWAYAVAEGQAELSAVAADPGDATVDELVALYQRVGGRHDDWDEYRRAMVVEKRLVLRVHVTRVYGAPPRD